MAFVSLQEGIDATTPAVAAATLIHPDEAGQEVERHQQASHNYSATGSKILELCQRAYSLYSEQKPVEQRRLLKTLLSNCTFDRGILLPTYNKPFDLLVQGNETKNWLPFVDTYRTRCLAPEPDFKRILTEVRNLTEAA